MRVMVKKAEGKFKKRGEPWQAPLRPLSDRFTCCDLWLHILSGCVLSSSYTIYRWSKKSVTRDLRLPKSNAFLVIPVQRRASTPSTTVRIAAMHPANTLPATLVLPMPRTKRTIWQMLRHIRVDHLLILLLTPQQPRYFPRLSPRIIDRIYSRQLRFVPIGTTHCPAPPRPYTRR